MTFSPYFQGGPNDYGWLVIGQNDKDGVDASWLDSIKYNDAVRSHLIPPIYSADEPMIEHKHLAGEMLHIRTITRRPEGFEMSPRNLLGFFFYDMEKGKFVYPNTDTRNETFETDVLPDEYIPIQVDVMSGGLRSKSTAKSQSEQYLGYATGPGAAIPQSV